jgi:hypothetical protein
MHLTAFPDSYREGAFVSFLSPNIDDVAREELGLAGTIGANVLLIGVGCTSRSRVEARLTLPAPVSRWEPGDRLVLPRPESTGSLVIHEVGLLTHDDQVRLSEWLEVSAGRTRVVCTSSESLLDRVLAGRFLSKLFYRLNTITQIVS